jgi:thiol-disulfide isomerase/thioredoxin
MWQKYARALLLLGCLAYGTAAPAAPAAQGAEPVVGQTVSIPAVTLLNGQTLPQGYFKGKPVVIEYWASWCPFCANQNPYVQKLSELAKKKGLQVLTVSIDRFPNDAKEYMRKHHYTFPVTIETPELRKVFGKRRVIPQIFVVDAQGRLAEAIPGEMFEEDVLGLIKYAPN